MQAYEELEDPRERGSVARTLAHSALLTGRTETGATIVRRAAAGLPPNEHELRAELESLLATAAYFSGRGIEPGRLEEFRSQPVGEGVAGKMRATMIAQTLFVTPKTVQMHLGNAYRKLGIAPVESSPSSSASTT